MVSRLKYWLSEPHYPNVGIEINSDAIRLAALSMDRGKMRIQHLDSVDVPAGAIEIDPFEAEYPIDEPVAEALKELWARNRFKSSRICLLIQDRAALSFQVTMEQQATSEQECIDLIRFKLKKNIPFRIEEARFSFWNASGLNDYKGATHWVIVVHDSVLKQYEKVIESSIGTECGLVDLTTFDVLNFVMAPARMKNVQEKDLLFVNLNREYISLAITQKEKLTFYRCRALEKSNGGVVEEALAEIHPTQMFFLDKLGGQNFERCFVYASEFSEELSSEIEKRVEIPSTILSLDSYFTDQVDATNVNLGRTFVPLVGLIASRKVEFV